MAIAPPYVRDATPIYPYAGGGGGSGMGGGGGSVYVGMLADNPDPATYGQWVVTANNGPWARIAPGTYALMISNGSSWFQISGSGGGGGSTEVDEVHVGPTPPPTPFDGQMWVDTTGTGGAGGGSLLEVYVDTEQPTVTGQAFLWVDPSGGAGLLVAPTSAVRTLSEPFTAWADTFDRPDANGAEAVSNGWTPDPGMLGDLNIHDHALQLVPGPFGGYQRYYTYAPDVAPFTGDIAVEVDWAAEDIRFGTGLMCRYDSLTSTGVRCWLTDPTTIELGDSTWYDAGNVSLETVEDFPDSWGAPGTNTLRLELRGTQASIYANDVLVRTGTIAVNADIADGAVGFCGEAGRLVRAIRVSSL